MFSADCFSKILKIKKYQDLLNNHKYVDYVQNIIYY